MNISELAKFRGGVSVDTISELSSASGVTADGVILKDSGVTAASGVSTNTITEYASGSGVTIDGVLLKDSGVTAASGVRSAWTVITAINAAAGTAGMAFDYIDSSGTGRIIVQGKDDTSVGLFDIIMREKDAGGQITTASCSAGGAWALGGTTAGSHTIINSDASNGTLIIQNNSGSSSSRPGIDIRKAPNDSTTSQIFMRFLIDVTTLNGGIRANGANVAEFYNTSDERLKNIVGEYTGGLSIVTAVPVDKYSWKSDSENKVTYGWVAQKLQQHLPEAVGADEDGILSVGTSDIPKILWSAIRELSAKNDALEARLAALEAK